MKMYSLIISGYLSLSLKLILIIVKVVIASAQRPW